MQLDLVCQFCKVADLIVLYVRQSIGDKQNYGEGRRKQKFTRIGVRCLRCGSVFLEPDYWNKWRDNQKDLRKYMKIRKVPKILKFIPYRKDWQSDRLVKVK